MAADPVAEIHERVRRWEAWAEGRARSDPAFRAWQGDVRRLGDLLCGATLTRFDYGRGPEDGDWSMARDLVLELTLPDGHRVRVHLEISSPEVDGKLGPAFGEATDRVEDVIYEHDLGLRPVTFDLGGPGPRAEDGFWDDQEWRAIPGYDREFLETDDGVEDEG